MGQYLKTGHKRFLGHPTQQSSTTHKLLSKILPSSLASIQRRNYRGHVDFDVTGQLPNRYSAVQQPLTSTSTAVSTLWKMGYRAPGKKMEQDHPRANELHRTGQDVTYGIRWWHSAVDRQASRQTGLLQDNWENSEAAHSTSAIYSLARRLVQSGGRFVTLPHYAWCVHENITSVGCG